MSKWSAQTPLDHIRRIQRADARRRRRIRHPVGRCFECHGDFAITKDGSIYTHQNPHTRQRCNGSGRIAA